MNSQEFLTSKGLFTAANIPDTHKKSFEEYLSREFVQRDQKVKSDIASKYGFELYYECKQDTTQGVTTYYIEHWHYLKISKGDVVCMLRSNKGKYYLHPYYAYDRLNYDDRTEFGFSVKEPNMIGVFSDRKINDWLDYCDAYVAEVNRVISEKEKKKSVSEYKVDVIIKSLPGAKVTRSGNVTYIETPYFYVTLTILNTGGMTSKVQFRGGVEEVIKLHSN